ncbi:MAG: hypothetical protein Q4C71_05220 [Microbacteriaceae bacterium]|nr:hypothetical protein [Microbacteriaceae bacterium]
MTDERTISKTQKAALHEKHRFIMTSLMAFGMGLVQFGIFVFKQYFQQKSGFHSAVTGSVFWAIGLMIYVFYLFMRDVKRNHSKLCVGIVVALSGILVLAPVTVYGMINQV